MTFRCRPRFAPRADESPARTARREPWALDLSIKNLGIDKFQDRKASG